MLRRKTRPPEPGPADEVARQRRRAWLLAAAGTLVVLLLIVAFFMALWLRAYPPIDPRWVKLPDAVAIVQVDWSGEGAPLVRYPIEAVHRRRLSGAIDLDTFWSTLNFALHSSVTLWILPPAGESEAGSAEGRAGPSSDFPWVAAGSLKRRHSWIEGQINRLLGRFGVAALNVEGSGAASGVSAGARNRLVGGVRRGALVLSTAGDRALKVLDTLVLAGKADRGEGVSPVSMDDVWAHLPQKAPLAFVVRNPARWAAPILRDWIGKDWREFFDALWPDSSALFAGAPWLVGQGTLPDADTLEIVLTWNTAGGSDARAQADAIRLLVRNINKAFATAQRYSLEAAPLPAEAPGQTGFVLRVSQWKGLFDAAPSGR